MFTRCLVLAQNHRAAESLCRAPRSTFALLFSARELPARGGGVLGANGLHGFSAAHALGGGQGDTYIVAWNLHPNDHALKLANLSIPSADPDSVVRGTKGRFPDSTTPVIEYIPPTLSAFMRRVMSLSTIDAIQYRPRKPGSTTTMAPGASRIVKGSFLRHQTMYGLVRGHAVDMEVAPAFALAVVDVESGFNPDAVSTAGALGLMQLMPSTITTLKVSNPFDPSQNVAAGLSLFKVYSRRYGTVDELLAAYHSGAEHLRRYGVTNSDREYIHRVVEKWHFYEHVLNDALVQEDPLGDALTLTSPLKM